MNTKFVASYFASCALLCIWVGNYGIHSFSLANLRIAGGGQAFCSSRFALNAKKATNKRQSSGSGGFGAAAVSTRKKSRSISSKSTTGSGTKALRDAANTFDKIRKEVGKEGTVDIYVKSPLNDPRRYWFAGKVCYLEGTNKVDAILSQKRLILEYAKNVLRPQNLGGPKYSPTLELWMAPGDSEMDCVQNKVTLQQVLGSTKDISPDFDVDNVGFNPEIYVGEEQQKGGLRLENLDENGCPTAPEFEINDGN